MQFRSLLAIGAFSFAAPLSPGITQATKAEIEGALTAKYKSCDKSANVYLGHCLAEELERQKARLNTTYSLVVAGENPEQRRLLKDAQKAWIAFRDADCALKEFNGSGAAISHYGCMLNHVVSRNLWLHDWGDL